MGVRLAGNRENISPVCPKTVQRANGSRLMTISRRPGKRKLRHYCRLGSALLLFNATFCNCFQHLWKVGHLSFQPISATLNFCPPALPKQGVTVVPISVELTFPPASAVRMDPSAVYANCQVHRSEPFDHECQSDRIQHNKETIQQQLHERNQKGWRRIALNFTPSSVHRCVFPIRISDT